MGRRRNGGAQKRNGGQNGNPAKAPRSQSNNGRNNNKASNSDYQAQIAQGNIPGTAGKDYPVNSLSAWRRRPGFENIELAPDHLIVPGYPGLGGGGGGSRKSP